MPRIVAEALREMSDLLPAVLEWPPERPALGVAAAIVDLLAPAAAEEVPACWLREEQRPTAARLIAAVRRNNGALLADPVGTGKTFVALAAADALRDGSPVAVLVPPPLREQWRSRAAACGVPVQILSHAEVSRNKVPEDEVRVLIIDESHHFRDPGTQRYDHLCRFAVGRSVICVTATPAVNRLEEIAHQLRLGVRDDALIRQGTPSLLAALRAEKVPSALGDLIIAAPASAELPRRKAREVPSREGPPTWLPALDALTLAGRSAVAGLIRGVLLTAAGSSPAALHAALTRYGDLLKHARDARAAGRGIDRSALRRFTSDAPEQLLLWELLPPVIGVDDLPLEDLPRVDGFRALIHPGLSDPKADRLASLLGDGVPTIIFTTSIATVPYLRERLRSIGPAWVTGSRAGWRHVTVPREQVFKWFAPGAPDVAPRVLLASDVAAEGLDLQRAARIIHYDLPWTAMRVAQREGRARRLGAVHTEVEVITFEPPAWLESRIGIARMVRQKGRLPDRAGLSGDDSPWRWRQDLAVEWTGVTPAAGTATVVSERESLLLAVEVTGGADLPRATAVAVVDRDGRWSEGATEVRQALGSIKASSPTEMTDQDLTGWRIPAAEFARSVLTRVREGGWASPRQSSESRALLGRLRPLLRRASRERRSAEVSRIESLIDFTARGHSAGEERQVATLLQDERLEDRTQNDPEPRSGVDNGALRIQIISAVIFAAR